MKKLQFYRAHGANLNGGGGARVSVSVSKLGGSGGMLTREI